MYAIVWLIIMIPFLIFAIVLSQGKGAFLIAGYNTMSNSEKEKYNGQSDVRLLFLFTIMGTERAIHKGMAIYHRASSLYRSYNFHTCLCQYT
ncbi:hypothetical protein ABH968_002570 [Lysinibacillus sp. RC79]